MIAINAVSAAFMTGVIWFVQVVHYPLFARVGDEGWIGYHDEHTRRVTYVVAPVMIVELGAAAVLAAQDASAIRIAGLAAAIATWVFTFALAVPDHRRLETGFDAIVARRLVTLGWARSAAWSSHAVLAAVLITA